jgi:hypothetical protein
MKKTSLLLTVALPLVSACAAVVGSTGQDTSFERVGTLNCEGTDVASQALVQGTTQNPVRCGPQSQTIPR